MASISHAQLTSLNGEALNDPSPTCWAGDILTGNVKVANGSDLRMEIKLQGRIRTAIGKIRHNPLLSDIEHLLVNADARTTEITHTAQKDSAIVLDREFGFIVKVPNAGEAERCMHFTDNSVLHHQMPPSTVSENDSRYKTQDDAANLVKITYCIFITTWENGHINTRKTLPIILKPKLQSLAFPRSQQSGGEIYVEKEWNNLGSLRVEVYCPDNHPLAWPPKADSAPINLRAKLVFTPIHPVWGLPPLTELSAKLISKTAFQKASAQGGHVWTKSQVLSKKTFAVGCEVNWVESTLTALTGGFEYVLWVPVPLQFPIGENMLTSFESCIAGREFAAHVSFVFGFGVGKDVDVVVPINIDPCIEATVAR